jgi:DNA-binding response OmpR family regulator
MFKGLALFRRHSKIFSMTSPFASKRVLVADDEEDICLYLKKYLERKKLKVTAVFDGHQAQKSIEEGLFDYILLDCSMPEMTGLELIEKARRRNPGAKIVLISGFPAVNDQVVQKLGGNLFIHKPIQLEEIDALFDAPVSSNEGGNHE